MSRRALSGLLTLVIIPAFAACDPDLSPTGPQVEAEPEVQLEAPDPKFERVDDTWSAKRRKARTGRNPRTGETIRISP